MVNLTCWTDALPCRLNRCLSCMSSDLQLGDISSQSLNTSHLKWQFPHYIRHVGDICVHKGLRKVLKFGLKDRYPVVQMSKMPYPILDVTLSNIWIDWCTYRRNAQHTEYTIHKRWTCGGTIFGDFLRFPHFHQQHWRLFGFWERVWIGSQNKSLAISHIHHFYHFRCGRWKAWDWEVSIDTLCCHSYFLGAHVKSSEVGEKAHSFTSGDSLSRMSFGEFNDLQYQEVTLLHKGRNSTSIRLLN